ncbi:choline transporter-like protein 4 [Amphibalanus amphitrite]|uniref:choline transporter-like protein 4 n=1 Tax=Amphibalanus amphitrite TaxID=1232801 RepID=UPI001C9051A2|nr:choline transporter-like protein 4 [Amphibalanus amphitrite]
MAVESPISRRRSCTDIPCLVLFAGFLVGWVVVAGIAMSQGSIKRFAMPSDSNGDICGVDKGVEKKPNLIFFDLTKCAHSSAVIFGCATPQMCVKECPDSYFFGAVPAMLAGADFDGRVTDHLKAKLRYCLPGVNRTSLTYGRLVDGYHCAPWYVRSRPVAGRCLPADIEQAVGHLQQLSSQMNQRLAGTEARLLSQRIQLMAPLAANVTSDNSTAEPGPAPSTNGTVGTDTNTTQPVNVTLPESPETSEGDSITKRVLKAASEAVRQMRFIGVHLAGLTCVSLVTPLVLALLVVLLLRCFIGPIVVLVLAAVAVLLAAASAICAHQYTELCAAPPTANDTAAAPPDGKEVPLQENPNLWLGLSVAAGCLLVLHLVLVLALRRRLVLAVAILEQCSAAIGDMLTVLLVPVLSFALQLLVCLLFVLVLVFLMGSPHRWRVFGECDQCDRYATGDICFPGEFAARCGEVCPNATCSSTQNLRLYAYNAFALVWGVCFVAAINQIVVAIAFSTWYFSTSKSFSLVLPLRAYVLALIFHSGTAAFGSLLISIVKVCRATLTWLKSRLEKRGGRLAGCLVSCCQCCFWCVENVIQFINRRAYIVTALESVGLCAAGQRGLAVVMRNLARVAVADSVTALVLWLSRLLVVAASVLLVHWTMEAALSEPVPWLLPAVFSGLIAYAVAGTAFSVFAMGVDTIFYCAMVDLDENDGSAARPYAMSRSLAKALGVSGAPPPTPGAGEPPPQGPVTGPPPGLQPYRPPSDFWSQPKQQPQAPGQFIHPGEVERPFTPATPLPSIPRSGR